MVVYYHKRQDLSWIQRIFVQKMTQFIQLLITFH